MGAERDLVKGIKNVKFLRRTVGLHIYKRERKQLSSKKIVFMYRFKFSDSA